jgi:hypothetical protein
MAARERHKCNAIEPIEASSPSIALRCSLSVSVHCVRKSSVMKMLFGSGA